MCELGPAFQAFANGASRLARSEDFTSRMVPMLDANENFVMLGNPSLGKRKATVARFIKRWKG